MKTIKDFGNISGFDMNWGKSALLYKEKRDEEEREVFSPFIKEVDSFKYLGIIVHRDIRRYLAENLDPLLSRFKANIFVWTKFPL